MSGCMTNNPPPLPRQEICRRLTQESASNLSARSRSRASAKSIRTRRVATSCRRRGGRAGAAAGASGVLRLLRLAFVGARPLDAGASDPSASRRCRSAQTIARRSRRTSRLRTSGPRRSHFTRPDRRAFERTYGWAWRVEAGRGAAHLDVGRGEAVGETNLQPLTDARAALPRASCRSRPIAIRTGVHPNTAFGLAFALDYATHRRQRGTGKEMLVKRSLDYFASDTGLPAEAPEPNGSDFFTSPTLDRGRPDAPRPFEAAEVRRLVPCVPCRG